MPADSSPSGPGSPHLPVPGPTKSHRNTGRSLSMALGASSPAYPDRNSPLPLHPAPPLPGSLITVSHVPSSQSCKPGAWKLSWIPPPSHLCPQDSTLPLPSYLPPPQPPLLSLSLPQHKPHISLFYSSKGLNSGPVRLAQPLPHPRELFPRCTSQGDHG